MSSGTTRQRSLADLARHEAPLPARRAAGVLVAVAAQLQRCPISLADGPAVSSLVELADDGSVRVHAGSAAGEVGDDPAVGASLGRWLFELLVGRAPLSSDEAFEPHLRAQLPPQVVALVARSCSASPGQWPTLAQWRTELERLAGAQAPPPPPHQQRRERRRRVVVALALVLLVLVCVAVVLLAPGWWDDATESGAASVLRGAVQASASS